MLLETTFQDCADAPTADEGPPTPSIDALRLVEANINPVTGLATDYLNSFNEAIMLLDMLSDAPDFRDDFLCWQPLSYREHFAQKRGKVRHAAIVAYESANPQSRARLEELTRTMTAVLETTRAVLSTDLSPAEASVFACETAATLKPLVARAAAVINGETYLDDTRAPQVAVDDLMKD